ncbi:MAG: copper amine oxidase N-terminal domain-containing protein [Peptococcaceae bacterium]|nr:copper amine oxidase N-terminal domain-containing protein [Peptococcaceae bacterium]
MVIVKNGMSEGIDAAPLIKHPGRVFIPARYLAEAFGYNVKWHEDKYMILWPKDQLEPDILDIEKNISKDDLALGANEEKEFVIPADTDLNLDISEDYVIVLIRLYLPLEPQYKDLNGFLGSKFDQKLVDEVIDHVKKKKNWREDLPLKNWQAFRYYLRALSPSGNDWIDIRVIKI